METAEVLLALYLLVGLVLACAEHVSLASRHTWHENLMVFACITLAWPYELTMVVGRWFEERRRR